MLKRTNEDEANRYIKERTNNMKKNIIKILIAIAILLLLIFIVGILSSIFVPIANKNNFSLQTCLNNVKLFNEAKNKVNCTDYNNILDKCDGIYLNKNFSEWNYQNEIKKCLEQYLKYN